MLMGWANPCRRPLGPDPCRPTNVGSLCDERLPRKLPANRRQIQPGGCDDWRSWLIRATASSMSPTVVERPKLNRTAPCTSLRSSPIDLSAGAGSLEPLAQAVPVATARPVRSAAITKACRSKPGKETVVTWGLRGPAAAITIGSIPALRPQDVSCCSNRCRRASSRAASACCRPTARDTASWHPAARDTGSVPPRS